MQNTYRFALACGAVPLVIGIVFYLLWLVTHLPVLVNVAAAVIVITILVVLAGGVALGRFAWQAFHTPGVQRAQVWRALMIAATLLSANLPVTAGLVGRIVIDNKVQHGS
ncbi:hypothetical protein ACXR0O_11185 [Verrucomicrobiota bacterium sgz303538]